MRSGGKRPSTDPSTEPGNTAHQSAETGPRFVSSDPASIPPQTQEAWATFKETISFLTNQAPPWVVGYLAANGSQIADAFYVRADQPTRTELLKELAELKIAARRIQRFTDMTGDLKRADRGVRVLLTERFGWHHSNSYRQMREPLEALIRGIEDAEKSPALVGPDGRTKMGRGKPDLGARIPAEEMCALVIATLYEHISGKECGPRNARACAAAEAYWRAIGLTRKSFGEQTETAWHAIFQNVRAEAFESERRAHREALVIWAATSI